MFTHLHLHTQYSLLDGAIRLKDLVKKAKEYNMSSVAITDHGNMYGAIDFYLKMKENGIKPILGAEAYYSSASRFSKTPEDKKLTHHLCLFAKNLEGYKNLSQIITKGFTEGFYYRPRADKELLKEFSKGLIASTACLHGEVSHHLLYDRDDLAEKSLLELRDIFGDDLYVELMENGLPEQRKVNDKLIPLARKHSLPLIATNDCHYLNKEDSYAHEVLLCIQTGKTINDKDRMKLTTDEFYFKSEEIMRKQFEYCSEAVDNTQLIVNKCDVNFKFKDEKGRPIVYLPNYDTNGLTAEEALAKDSREGLQKRLLSKTFKTRNKNVVLEDVMPTYQERLEYEINMINQTGFSGYFLIVADFIRYAKENGIPVGPGRGSGAGSLVAYCLGITNIDPIPYNLLFERFINPERISMPDFDVDFCQDRREEVISYVINKYGKDKVSQIVTFGTLSAKACIKDVGRVFDISFEEMNAVTKLFPNELNISLSDAIEKESKLRDLMNSDSKMESVFNIALKLEGLFRQTGVHAAGVVITDKPIVEYAPLCTGKDNVPCVQYDKKYAEKIGLVKYDFLGLKTLTFITTAVDLVRKNRKGFESFDIEEIPLDDSGVYDLICSGDNDGIFQLESDGMKSLCQRLKPSNLEDVTAVNALYRPGPLGSGMVDDFIDRKHGRTEMKYEFAELEEVLKETYGVVVYQEQVQRIARVLAGYSLGEADILRRAMGKKDAEEMSRQKTRFLDGCAKNNFDPDKASALFDLMAKFAEYGFNKSHAVAYAYISYQTAYIKKYFTPEFYAALMSTEMGDSDKISRYIKDAKDHGISILSPNINKSHRKFGVEDGHVRFGMGAIKNVGDAALEEIFANRKEKGEFESFVDFCSRVSLRKVNKKVLESLIKTGVLDNIGEVNRASMLASLDNVITYAQSIQEDLNSDQFSMFDSMASSNKKASKPEPGRFFVKVEEFKQRELLEMEKELTGFYISGHPLDEWKDLLTQMSDVPVLKMKEMHEQQKDSVPADQQAISIDIATAGKLTVTREILIGSGRNKGLRMARASFEDFTGAIDAVMFSDVYEKQILGKGFSLEDPIYVQAQLKIAQDKCEIHIRSVKPLISARDSKFKNVSIKVNLDEDTCNDTTIRNLKSLLMSYQGTAACELEFFTNSANCKTKLPKNIMVSPSNDLINAVNSLLGGENNVELK